MTPRCHPVSPLLPQGVPIVTTDPSSPRSPLLSPWGHGTPPGVATPRIWGEKGQFWVWRDPGTGANPPSGWPQPKFRVKRNNFGCGGTQGQVSTPPQVWPQPKFGVKKGQFWVWGGPRASLEGTRMGTRSQNVPKKGAGDPKMSPKNYLGVPKRPQKWIWGS